MADKTDLIYELISKMETRQHEKMLKDAERHAGEDAWRKGVEIDLNTLSTSVSNLDNRMGIVEKPKELLNFLFSKTGKVTTGISCVISLAWMIYRMIN